MNDDEDNCMAGLVVSVPFGIAFWVAVYCAVRHLL